MSRPTHIPKGDKRDKDRAHLFGEMLGDNTADTILDGLKRVHPAVYRELFGGNARASAIAAALVRLKGLGLAKVDVIKRLGFSARALSWRPDMAPH